MSKLYLYNPFYPEKAMKHAPSKVQRRPRLLKRDKKRVRRQAQLKRRRAAKGQGKSLVHQLYQTMTHFFPDLYL